MPFDAHQREPNKGEYQFTMAAKNSRTALAGTFILAIIATAIAVSAFVSAPGAGQRTYESSCASCHEAGAHGAPHAGRAHDWASRIERGRENLYEVALKGKTAGDRIMPPRGGNPRLTDEQVKQAVDYLIERSRAGK
jgi:cytochrome c5